MKKIIVADNIEMNRSILCELFENNYDFVETDSSETAFKLLMQYKNDTAIFIINENIAKNFESATIKTLKDLKIFKNIPTILIVNNDYYNFKKLNIDFPCSDIISSPINPYIIKKRVANLIDLYSHKNELENLVQKQTEKIINQDNIMKIQQKKINTINNDMLDTLNTVIEYRDVESGRHIHRIRAFTKVLLEAMAKKYPKYNLTPEKIDLITSASSMHDIGKIAIPDAILLSPKRLTYDEFRIMKQHTLKGCEILNQLDAVEKNEYFKYCYQICKYHHEKWDGLGYPDGLVGDEIPICAQVVSVADCYDALTSDRPYKAAFTHEQAVDMIRTGACGAFSEEIMDCFSQVLTEFEHLSQEYADINNVDRNISEDSDRKKYINDSNEDHSKDIYLKMSRDDLIKTIQHQKKIMEETHRRDSEILYRISDFVFECDLKHDTFYDRKNTIEKIYNYIPKNYNEAVTLFANNCSDSDKSKFIKTFRLESIRQKAEKGKKRISLECFIKIGKNKYSPIKCTVVPFMEDGVLRKIYCSAIIVHNKNFYKNLNNIDYLDPITGALNFYSFKDEINDYLLHSGKNGYHLFVNIDIDDFKNINRHTDYQFGNTVLCDIANELKDITAKGSIIGRAEDDNFLVFIKDCPNNTESVNIVETIFRCLHKTYKFNDKISKDISVSMGVASYPSSNSFEELFENSTKASDIAKINGKNMYLFYNDKMKENWAIKQYAQIVKEEEKVDFINFEKLFIPVTDSKTGEIISYDFIEIPKTSGKSISFDEMYESVYNGNNITALSLNSIRRIFSAVYSMEQEKISMPEISVLTVLNGYDADIVIKAIGEMLNEYPVNCKNICINFTQDMLKTLNMNGLFDFVEALRKYGFKTGIYNVGMNSINIKCFTDKLFDRVIFAHSFLNDVTDGIYPVGLITHLIEYFSNLGTEVYMPVDVDKSFINLVKHQTKSSFGVHYNKMMTVNEFKENMRLASITPKCPILSHESTSLVLNEKMYDEILEHTKSFIFEWIPRTDTIKISGSFKKMYGYNPKPENFISELKENNFIHSDDIRKFIETMNFSRSGSNDAICLVRVYNINNNEYIWNKMRLVSINNAAGRLIKVIGIGVDISDERYGTIDKDRHSRTDYITNLYNKNTTKNKIKNYLYDEGLSGKHTMIIAEVCNFDELGKKLGTVFANAVIKEIATNIRDIFRDSDIIGQNSGNQFIVFIKNMDDTEKLKQKAEQIISIINNKYQSDSEDIIIYGKTGIAISKQKGVTYDELHSNALKALYFAKHNINKNYTFINETEIKGFLP